MDLLGNALNKIEELKAALHDAEAIGDFSDELRSRYRLKQEIERLKGENEEFKTALDETLQRKQDALIQRNNLREVLERIRKYVSGWGLEKEVHEMIDEALRGSDGLKA